MCAKFLQPTNNLPQTPKPPNLSNPLHNLSQGSITPSLLMSPDTHHQTNPSTQLFLFSTGKELLLVHRTLRGSMMPALIISR